MTHHLHHDPAVDDMLRAANARAEAAERRLAEQQAAAVALADEYDERSADTEDGERYPWGVAADDLHTLSDPTALDALIAWERAAALREAADDWQTGQWADAPRLADRVAERIANAQHVTDWLRTRARAEAER